MLFCLRSSCPCNEVRLDLVDPGSGPPQIGRRCVRNMKESINKKTVSCDTRGTGPG